jgi:hypothetical protein
MTPLRLPKDSRRLTRQQSLEPLLHLPRASDIRGQDPGDDQARPGPRFDATRGPEALIALGMLSLGGLCPLIVALLGKSGSGRHVAAMAGHETPARGRETDMSLKGDVRYQFQSDAA